MPADVMLLLLRHGQSEWNAIQRWQGSFDSPLTELGRQQALETAWALAGLTPSFDAIWASDLSRAAETARIIADALCLQPPKLDARLREAHAGEWEGLTPDEIERDWPGWLSEHKRPVRFESFERVIERVMSILDDIVRTEIVRTEIGATVLVVAHSGVIRSLVRHLGATDDRVPNLGGIWVEASINDDRQRLTLNRFTLKAVFDPDGIVISGVDVPGEEPG